MKWHLLLLVPHQNSCLRGEGRGEKAAKGLFSLSPPPSLSTFDSRASRIEHDTEVSRFTHCKKCTFMGGLKHLF